MDNTRRLCCSTDAPDDVADTGVPSGTASSPALKVFLVEDSVAIRQRLAALLGAIESVAIVGEADDPAAALAGIAASGADVAIVDLRLARGTSGLDVLNGLARCRSPVMPIMLTNFATPQFQQSCFDAGAHFFFDKTHEFALLRHAVRELAAKRLQP